MKFSGGFNISIPGRPSADLERLPEPRELHIPLRTRRFHFSHLEVSQDDHVRQGQVLARDPENFAIPLLSPRRGTVCLNKYEGHITLENIETAEEEPFDPDSRQGHVPHGRWGEGGMKRFQLKEQGVWEFFSDAHTGTLPDPMAQPSGIIVTTLNLEPFTARGDIQLETRLNSFTRGLEHLQSLLEYQPIYLIMPESGSDIAKEISRQVRGYASIRLTTVEPVYPNDSPALLARQIGPSHAPEHPVWALDVAGVLAVDRCLTYSLPSTIRIITVGGPAVSNPRHLMAVAGYPLTSLLEREVSGGHPRVVNGGIFHGETLSNNQQGLDSECRGLTLLEEPGKPTFLGWMRPGAKKKSYSKAFIGNLIPSASNKLETALNGEKRPCIACQYCERVCPVPILPHQIHKDLYRDALEDIERSGTELCIECGLCTYVCPSKIDLRTEIVEARGRLQELQSELEQTDNNAAEE